MLMTEEEFLFALLKNDFSDINPEDAYNALVIHKYIITRIYTTTLYELCIVNKNFIINNHDFRIDDRFFKSTFLKELYKELNKCKQQT